MPYHWSSPLDATQRAVKSNGRAGLQLHITAHNALSSVGFFFYVDHSGPHGTFHIGALG